MTERKIKKKFLRQEKSRLKKRILRLRSIVNEILQEEFGRRLFNLKHDDELRLLTLYVWRDRYKVSIKYILKILLPIWNKKFSRFKTKMALGCRVPTLVGKRSEEILQEKLWRDFPNKENKTSWKQSEQDRINKLIGIGDRRKKKRQGKYSSVLEAPNPKAFIKAYRKELTWKDRNKLSKDQQRQLKEVKTKCYRNNPFQ